MSPRFDRRRDQGQGGGEARGSEARGGDARGAKPGRGSFEPRARSGRQPFSPRGEWRPDAPSSRGGEPSGRPGRRFEGGGSMGEGRPGAGRKPFGRRPDDRRPSGGRGGDSPRFGEPRRYGDGPRQGEGSRFGQGSRFGDGGRAGRVPAGRFADGGRPSRPDGRRLSPRPDAGRFERGDLRPSRPPGRPQLAFDRRGGGGRPAPMDGRTVAVEVPTAEAERFNAGPADDLIWGRHAAQAALEAGRPIHRIWCTTEMRFQPRFLQLLREAKASGVLVEEVTWARLGQLTEGAVHQGIVLQAAAADTLDLASLIDGCRHLGEPPLLMALDGITDPHNLGAIVRSAEALGAHGLVLPQRRSAGLTGSVAKVAAGALEHLPVARVVNLNRSLDALKQEGYRVIGLAGEGSIALSEADLEGPLVIVTGSESDGLSLLTRKHCDQLVRIPLRGATPSLNASVATAMVLYEVARRGWMSKVVGSAPAPRLVRPQLPTSQGETSGSEAVDGGQAPGEVAATAAAPLPQVDSSADASISVEEPATAASDHQPETERELDLAAEVPFESEVALTAELALAAEVALTADVALAADVAAAPTAPSETVPTTDSADPLAYNVGPSGFPTDVQL